MSVNLVDLYQVQFAQNVQLLLQQKGSALAGTVQSGSHKGKQASPVNQIGAITANKVVGRFSPKTRVDAPVDRRWVFPQAYDLPQLVDTLDELMAVMDPQSSYVQNALNALGRAQDDEIITAFFGTAKTGEQGATSTTFGTTVTSSGGRNVAVATGGNAATGLNVAKLKEGLYRLRSQEVAEDEQIWCAITARQEQDLLNEIQVISTDFQSRPVLEDGKIVRWGGINFKRVNRLQNGTDNAAGTSRMIPMWAQSGMYLGTWEGITSKINQRVDLQKDPYEVYAYGTFGATRLEENKVVRIWCREP